MFSAIVPCALLEIGAVAGRGATLPPPEPPPPPHAASNALAVTIAAIERRDAFIANPFIDEARIEGRRPWP
jgi:hypothetical protein